MFSCTLPDCGYSWAENPLGVEIDLDLVGAPDELGLFCPKCGLAYGDRAKARDLGVVHLRQPQGQYKVVQWEDDLPANPAIRLVGKVQRCKPADICFPAMPLLRHSDGQIASLVVPDLPVRQEYLGLVDWARLETLGLDEKRNWKRRKDGALLGWFRETDGKYIARIPLAGRADLLNVELPVVGQDFRRVSRKEEALAGFDLSVWPRVRSVLWKTFLVRCTATDDGATMVDDYGKQGGIISVRPYVSEGADISPLDDDDGVVSAYPGSSVFGARARQAVIPTRGRGRPTQIVLQGARNGTTEWGGVFLPMPSAAASGTGSSTETMGVDFGTSNSCVSFKSVHSSDESSFGVLGMADLDEWLVRSRSTSEALNADQYTIRFARRGFGTRDAILPTEILVRQPAGVSLSGGAGAVARWLPGRDYAIPGSDVVWERRSTSQVARGTEPLKQAVDIEPHLLSGFKWKEAEGGPKDGDAARPWLMAAYLRCLFVQELALLIAKGESGPAPFNTHSVNVVATYPGKWAADEINGLGQAISTAWNGNGDDADCVASWAQIKLVEPGIDKYSESYKNESLAASQASLSGHSVHSLVGNSTHLLDVMVDIGGGSTDIALVWRGLDGRLEFEALSSIRYAGEDVILALDGGGNPVQRTFVHGMGKADLRYQLRRSGPNDSLFDSTKRNAGTRRLTAFYVQLAEYIARLVAAQIANGQFGLHSSPDADTLQARLTLLGSGWGLAALPYGSQFGRQIGYLVEERANELVAELSTAGTDFRKVKIQLTLVAPPAGLHPKFAVAAGAAGAGSMPDGAQPDVRYATLVKFGKTGADLEKVCPSNREILGLPAICRGRQVEWWRIVEADGAVAWHIEAAHGARLEAPTLDWPEVVAADPSRPAMVPGCQLARELYSGFGGESVKAGLVADKDAVIHQVFGTQFKGFLRRGLMSALLEKGLRSRLAAL